MNQPCTAECWTRVECPDCGNLMAPRGRSAPMEMYQGRCCEEYGGDSRSNPCHLWDEHDSTRHYTDPEGWAAHVASCPDCGDEES